MNENDHSNKNNYSQALLSGNAIPGMVYFPIIYNTTALNHFKILS